MDGCGGGWVGLGCEGVCEEGGHPPGQRGMESGLSVCRSVSGEVDGSVGVGCWERIGGE